MTYKTIEYQEKHVNELLEKISNGRDGRYSFLAPTGSGKTIMMSKFLERFSAKCPNHAFIWASPRKNLPLQSKEKIGYSGIMDCVLTDTITANRKIEENQIWFVNWEKMSGNLMKDTEQGNSLEDIVKNTRDDKLKIMLLVDEAHWGAQKSGTQVSYAIDEIINADIVIYITATPKHNFDTDHTVEICPKTVRDSEMIVSEIPLNYDLEEDDITMEADEKLLDMACKRRMILKRQYEDEGTTINPLLMVQIPNSRDGELKRDIVEKVLRRHNMTEERGNFVSLEEKRRNDEYVKNISDNDNAIDAVIFKQNVSLGWDCPRAKILVGLRDTKEPSFRLQTLGRIMRMPEQKYYKNHEMNVAYFYSEAHNFDYSDDGFQNILRGTARTKRKPHAIMQNLPAIRIRMVDPQEGLNTETFRQIFINEAKELRTVEGMKRIPEVETTTIYTSDDITTPDKKIKDGYATLQNEMTVQKEFEQILSGILDDDNIKCKSLFNMEFIRILIKEGIYQIFVEAGEEKSEAQIYYQLRNSHNIERIKHPIFATMNKHEDIMRELVQRGVDHFDWNIPELKLLTKCGKTDLKKSKIHPNCVVDYSERFNKYAMSPAYVEIASELEMNFCNELDQSKNVKWWYKNGTGQGDFAIVYYEGCRPRRFMPDFIVGMNDGRIGIFDTKSGDTLEKAGPKSKALYDYVDENSGLKLFGGIVTFGGDKWKVNDGYDFSSNFSHLGWEKLVL